MDLDVNRRPVKVECDPATPLLWVLRDHLSLTGTKFGCGVAACGACTVRGRRGRAVVRAAGGGRGRPAHHDHRGLAEAPGKRHALQQAWIDEQVPQCGYCQSGMLMAAADLLARQPDPSDADIDAAITNLCRCGTYPRVRTAIKRAAQALREGRA